LNRAIKQIFFMTAVSPRLRRASLRVVSEKLTPLDQQLQSSSRYFLMSPPWFAGSPRPVVPPNLGKES
jgi:hypothetical protein